MSDENVGSFKDANEKLIRDFKGEVDKLNRDIPEEARDWIKEKLTNGPFKSFYQYVDQHENEVVQIDYNFWGEKPNKTKWKLKLTISADMPNQLLKQGAYFGGEVYLNDKRKANIHKWLPDGMLKIGRPTEKCVELEKYPSAPEERKIFQFGGNANWTSESTKYPLTKF
ncbi:unnamed protein product [Adineta steineri]|uniref:Uncharacterized protein n=1 Tax=Adineta steineri TaxID=433720 RepID=A0A819GCY3_9BILA|nr:unnamed protein product [Adineta steineri]CAF3881290.1 unnamed protein product [Adineta steineri]